MKDSHTNQEAGKQSAEQVAKEKYPPTFESGGIQYDDTFYKSKREAFIAGAKWLATQPAAATPGDDWLIQDLKELDASFDYLCKMEGVKDAGHKWIEFTDKWNAFKNRLLLTATNQFAAPQAVKWVQAKDRLPGWYKEARWRHPTAEINELMWTSVAMETCSHLIEGLEWIDEGSTDKNETK